MVNIDDSSYEKEIHSLTSMYSVSEKYKMDKTYFQVSSPPRLHSLKLFSKNDEIYLPVCAKNCEMFLAKFLFSLFP